MLRMHFQVSNDILPAKKMTSRKKKLASKVKEENDYGRVLFCQTHELFNFAEIGKGRTVITHGLHNWEAAWSENGKCVSKASLL